MRALFLTAAGALLAGATALGPEPTPIPELGRDLVRPLLLPVLWSGLESAQLEGSPEEYAARGRILMRLIPEWTDGHIHVAGQLAFEASLAHRDDTAAAADRLLAGLEYLAEALTRTTAPAAREALLRSQARFLYIRASQDPALAEELQSRTGESPMAGVTRYLRQIPRLSEAPVLQSELCFTLIEGMAIDARLGKPLDHLRIALDQALEMLPALRDQLLATRVGTSLRKLRSYLVQPDESLLEDLRPDPFLENIVEALRSRRRSGR